MPHLFTKDELETLEILVMTAKKKIEDKGLVSLNYYTELCTLLEKINVKQINRN